MGLERLSGSAEVGLKWALEESAVGQNGSFQWSSHLEHNMHKTLFPTGNAKGRTQCRLKGNTSHGT